ncbi:MAG: 23S rRNA (pseudouridine(1915)-N(3))-methyltransferase RlmH [Clostridia bacterium]|nr:23S rRNA (pseudouridine(1915)-N(3))-methyltransferase RlmH [Clostridia bacterium]
MNIRIVCVGKIKESFYRDAIKEYEKRLSRFCKFEIIEVNEELIDPNLKNLDVVKEKEGERILQKAQGYLIALAINGNNISSEEHAKKINELSIRGISTITYIIGGSYGLGKNVLDKVDYSLSFGKLTYPHQLMRVVLSEQIYRAYTILEGSSYHK